MDCAQALALLSAQLDNELQPGERSALEAHLADCAGCRATAEVLRLQDADLRRAFAPRRQAAAAVAERVLAQLHTLPQPRPPLANGRRYSPWLPMLLSAAAGFLLAVLVFRPWQQPAAVVVASTAPEKQPAPAPVAEMVQLALCTGAVEARLPGKEDWQPVPSGGQVEIGCRVRTPPQVRCEFRTRDGSEVRLNGDTELQFRAARQLTLDRGQILASVAEGVAPFEVAIADATVTALGTQFDLWAQPAATTLSVLQGSTRVQGRGAAVVVKTDEVATIVRGQVVETQPRRREELVRATDWVAELLILKGRDNKELAARIDDILAQIGEGKTAYFSEEEIRKLGDHCVLPLTRFIQSDRSQGPERQQRRIEAARILADLAQTCSIPDLINLLTDKDREVRYYAAQALVRLTRETPGGLTPSKWRDAPADQRELALKAWQSWWRERKPSYPCPRD